MNKWIKRFGFVVAFGVLAHHTDFVDAFMGHFNALQQPVTQVVSRTFTPEAHAAGGGSWITGKVVSVADGDTLTVDTGAGKVKVRLLAIDAPEVGCGEKQRNCTKKAQPFGEQAKIALSRAALKETVKVRLNGETTYDRQVGTVFLNGKDLNYALVQEGYAWHYSKFAGQQPENEADLYAKAQAKAQAEKKGLWSQSNPVPPWAWRKGK
jgi:endonuclease YncB( thermonuclease family)